ncbi:MAG: DUF368 domain-containing protein [Deltaproteobacteria bacterium]|nr:DUF368 domain-containing protein [Deltaproteobacteria bacterium]MBW2531304.1 DUF368 domain-containing protein [Deltaproteobacteria bacterium]
MKHLIVLIKGALIGIANVIPGVSGGTFALVLGIYDRLISALKSFDLRAIRVGVGSLLTIHRPASRKALMEEVRRTDLIFLGVLGIGAVVAIKGLAGVLQWLLSDHPMPTLAFFVGLIIPSIAVPARMMDRRGPIEAIACAAGVALTVAVSMGQVSSGGEEPALWLVFGGGAVAIAAMILPGISGSFVLLVLGLYQATLEHIHHITSRSLVFLGVMAAGFVFGVVTISRAMAWLLKHQRSATLAFLIGLIFGSFYVLWPFKDYEVTAEAPAASPQAVDAPGAAPGPRWESADPAKQPAAAERKPRKQKISIRVATAPNRLPRSVGEIAWPGLMLLLGLGCAAGLNRLGRAGQGDGEEKPEESDDEPQSGP